MSTNVVADIDCCVYMSRTFAVVVYAALYAIYKQVLLLLVRYPPCPLRGRTQVMYTDS